MAAAAAAAGTRVPVGDPGRHYLPTAGLRPLSEHTVATTVDLRAVPTRRVRVYALQG